MPYLLTLLLSLVFAVQDVPPRPLPDGSWIAPHGERLVQGDYQDALGGGAPDVADPGSSTQAMKTTYVLDADGDGNPEEKITVETWRRSGETITSWYKRHAEVTAFFRDAGWILQ